MGSRVGEREPLQIRAHHLFIVAAVIQLAVAIVAQHRFGLDVPDYQDFYRPVTESLLDGRGYEVDGAFATRYPPGYPVILLVPFTVARWFGFAPTTAVLFMNALLTGATTTGVFLLTRRHLAERPALFAAAAWMIYPFSLLSASVPLSEVPFITLVIGAMLVFPVVREHRQAMLRTVATGGLLGLAALVRPTAVGIAVVFVVWLVVAAVRKWDGWSVRGAIAASFLVSAGFFSVVLPWEVIAWRATDQVLPISANSTPSMIDGLQTGIGVKPAEQGRTIPWPEDVAALLERAHARRANFRSPADIARFLLTEMQDQPLTLLKLLAMKGVRAWFGTYSLRYETFTGSIQILFLLPVLVGIPIVLRSQRARPSAVLWLMLCIYFWAATVSVAALARYMLPAMATLMPFAGSALSQLGTRLSVSGREGVARRR